MLIYIRYHKQYLDGPMEGQSVPASVRFTGPEAVKKAKHHEAWARNVKRKKPAKCPQTGNRFFIHTVRRETWK